MRLIIRAIVLFALVCIGFSDCPIFRKIATVVDNG